MSTVRATFHATYPPYVAGDVAGLGRELAERLRARRIVSFTDPAAPTVDLATLDRAGLLALARDRLGLVDEPPAEVDDDQLRDALRGVLEGGAPAATVDAEAAPGWDRLDVMDRVHLEAFAAEKCRMGAIDPEMDDAELRRQIRTTAAATLNTGEPASAVQGQGRRR